MTKILTPTVALFLLIGNAFADNLFLDTFEDGNATDGAPLNWTIFPGLAGGQFDVVNGDLEMNESAGLPIALLGEEVEGPDVSLKVAFDTRSQPGVEDCLTLPVRVNTSTLEAYGAGICTDAGLYVWRTRNSGWQPDFIARHETELLSTSETLFLQFDAIGNQLNLSAWTIDGSKPSSPQISITDDTIPNGGAFGMIKCCDVSSATIQFLQVASSPVSDLPGDFNSNNAVDTGDIDLLADAIGSTDALFDINRDGVVDSVDHTDWVAEAAHTYIGDANLDGEFNSGDFVEVFKTGKYETGEFASWAQGDWNGDRLFGSGDFVTAFKDGGYEMGPRAVFANVPEPASSILLNVGTMCLFSLFRRGREIVTVFHQTTTLNTT